LIFFFDNCVSPKLMRAMRELDAPVRHLQEELPEGTTDEVWLPHVAAKTYHVVTTDHAIAKRPTQRKIVKDNKLICFFIAGGFERQDKWEQFRRMVGYWPTILRTARAVKHDTKAQLWFLQQNGKIERRFIDD
jgi:hypothetical protein